MFIMLLHFWLCLVVDSVVEVWELHAAFIFRVDLATLPTPKM
jgi:hypothetical protein